LMLIGTLYAQVPAPAVSTAHYVSTTTPWRAEIMKPLQANVLAGALGLGLLVAGGQVHAAATIINPAGTVALGVNDHGHLNTATGNVALNASRTGLAYNFPGDGYRDATSPGCYCEGWGVSVNNA